MRLGAYFLFTNQFLQFATKEAYNAVSTLNDEAKCPQMGREAVRLQMGRYPTGRVWAMTHDVGHIHFTT